MKIKLKLLPRQSVYVLAFSALVLAIGVSLLNYGQKNMTAITDQTIQQRTEKRAALNHIHEDSLLTQKLNGAADAEDIEHVLMPVDRLEISTLIERQGRIAHIDHLVHNITPEQKLIIETPLAGKITLAQSAINCEGDIVIDNDLYSFLDSLRRRLPGRVRIVRLQIERVESKDTPHLHFKSELEWLSNGAGDMPGTKS